MPQILGVKFNFFIKVKINKKLFLWTSDFGLSFRLLLHEKSSKQSDNEI